MNRSPEISVVMPVYNGEKYLKEAVESILSQTYKDFEFIIAYDTSSDKSLDIIKNYQEKDSRIILSMGKKRGLIKSLNDALKISNGRYIARMDADDISLPGRFEAQVKFMKANPEIGMCGTWIEVFGDVDNNYVLKYPATDELLKLRLLFSVPFAHPSIMIKQKLIAQHGLKYNEKYDTIEDYKFWLDVSKYTKFASIPEVLINYRYLKTSLSKVASRDHEKRYIASKKVFSEVLERLGMRNTEQENRLHFIIGLNERIAKESIDLKFLNQYLNKLIEANKITKIFNEKALERIAAKKFIVVVYYKIKKKDFSFLGAVFYKFFLLGVIRMFDNTIS